MFWVCVKKHIYPTYIDNRFVGLEELIKRVRTSYCNEGDLFPDESRERNRKNKSIFTQHSHQSHVWAQTFMFVSTVMFMFRAVFWIPLWRALNYFMIFSKYLICQVQTNNIRSIQDVLDRLAYRTSHLSHYLWRQCMWHVKERKRERKWDSEIEKKSFCNSAVSSLHKYFATTCMLHHKSSSLSRFDCSFISRRYQR